MNRGEPAVTSAVADNGDRAQALEDAFARYQGELLGTLYYLVGSAEDARDALQEAFIKCWRHRAELHEIDNLKAWVFRVVLNTGRDMRACAWRRRRQGLEGSDRMMETSTMRPDDAAIRAEELQFLRAALAGLRPEEQEVFLLRQNGEMTYDEIGHALGLPTGTVKTRMRLALAKLRKALAY